MNKRFEPATLDCCHIMGRRSLALRWHPANALAMCRKDHIFYTEHPFDFRDFCIDHFGEELIAELRLVSNQPVKWSNSVREDIYKHYQQELKKMEKKRLTTELMIEFEAHEIMHEFADEDIQNAD